MSSQPQVISTSFFAHDGRGPSLKRWLKDNELYLPGSFDKNHSFVGDIIGAQYLLPQVSPLIPTGIAWTIFYGLQVIQIVPEEVHSYWHLDHTSLPKRHTGVWEVVNSSWANTFNSQHLNKHKHFIIEFYDEIVEVICRELVFGSGDFTIEIVAENDVRFLDAYLHYAEAQEKQGNIPEAKIYFQKYIDRTQDQTIQSYAQRRLTHLDTT